MPADDAKNPVGYLCFKKNTGNGPEVLDVQIGHTLEDIEAWKKLRLAGESGIDEAKLAASQAEAEPTESAPQTPLQKTFDLLRRMKTALLAFHPLITLNSALPPIVQAMIAEQRLFRLAQESMTVVSDDEIFIVYAVPSGRIAELSRTMAGIEEVSAGYSVIPGSVMLSLVATFDSFMSEFLRLLLVSRPERFARSDKTLTVREILGMKSFDEVVEKVIDDEIDQIMRGSHAAQVEYIEKNFKISIREGYTRWDQFIEIFERRNLVAHGNQIVNKIYLANCEDAGVNVANLSIGDKLNLDREYLHKAVNTLAEFALLAVISITLKNHAKDRGKIYSQVNELCLDLIREKRARLASWLLDFALNKQTPKVADSTVKMMTVNYANALRKIGDVESCNRVIDKTDWSATSDNYQICVAALRDDVDAVIRLMPRVHQSESVTAQDIRTWPVFDWIRDNERVRAEFETLYGEPLLNVPLIPPAFHEDETRENAGK